MIDFDLKIIVIMLKKIRKKINFLNRIAILYRRIVYKYIIITPRFKYCAVN